MFCSTYEATNKVSNARAVPGVEDHQALVQHPDSLAQEEYHTQKENLCSFEILSSAEWNNKKFFELVQNFLLKEKENPLYIISCHPYLFILIVVLCNLRDYIFNSEQSIDKSHKG